jgi:restriction endonuclease S subunit
VARFLNSNAGQAALAKIMSGAYIKTIRKTELQELKVPVPPLETQRRLVEMGDVVEDCQTMLRNKEQLLVQLYDQALKAGGNIK